MSQHFNTDHGKEAREFATSSGGGALVSLLITLSAIVIFVVSAGAVIPEIVRSGHVQPTGPEFLLTNALLLSTALILLSWNRHKALSAELELRRKSEEEARRQAEMDDLTACLNRRSFVRKMESWLEHSSCDQDLATIAIDIDNFKQVNDLNGHAAGDKVLREVSARIAGLLPTGSYIARLGGDEFICAVPFFGLAEAFLNPILGRMVEVVARPVLHKDIAIEISVSIGVVTSRQAAEEDIDARAQSLMHKADIAMYHAKKHGKNRYCWFEGVMENDLHFRNELEAGIRRGVQNGEFVPYYEQQIDLDTGEIVGFEMLARWESPEMGLIGPDIFIPIAEEIGLISIISERLIVAAFEDAKKWHSSISLSVNISPVQMRDPWFAQKILKLLLAHRFPAQRLEIEVTETCLHENIGMVRSMIMSLRNQGVRISLDDFGTGYASISQLRSLPFDRLKIDRSFIAELKAKDGGDQMVDAIISMGHGLKLPITAEGIENAEVLSMLKRWGSMKGQGYHYGRPEPASQVLERLRACDRLAISSPQLDEREAEQADDRSESKILDSDVRAG
ncbi:putative bifunctional diguanylate cyclase/phosphodiesterase [Qipengyuania sp. NPDC077563]|uniref:putative bifunctional diguanylate cyclase/phosphodiesterase n=1 Tax=Qipengyuania sp. NPDC077563 TaxID=3364497 RepID=UPI00384B8189